MDFPIRMDPWRIIEEKFFECEQFETFFQTVAGSLAQEGAAWKMIWNLTLSSHSQAYPVVKETS